MRSLRVFLLGGVLSYRALFNWTRPALYIPSLLGKPAFQLVFFTYLGRYSGLGDDRFFIVGNAMQAAALAGLFGMVLLLVNERGFGTLAPLLATPANRLALYFGRAVPVAANGVVMSAFGLGFAFLVLGFRMPPAALPAFAGTVALTAVSCAMFGLAFGAVALRANDLWVGSNLTNALLLLLCGVNVPLSVLPGWLAAVGRALPLTHGVEAARQLAAGAGVGEVSGLIGREALVGLLYAAAGYALLRLFEAEDRRRATLDAV